MDGKKFDEITRNLANGISRRGVIKGVAGSALGAVTGIFGAKQLADAAPKPTPTPAPTSTPDPGQCVSFHTTGQGCNNPPGNNCCATDFCIGDNINNPGAGKCGSCAAGTTFCPNPTHVAFCCNNATQACVNGECCTLPVCPAGANCGTVTNACGTVTCGTACTAAGDACHDPGACINNICNAPAKPNGTACDDGNACTSGTTCQNGACTGGTTTTCTASDQCHVAGTCDPATGNCSNPNAANGISCNDSNACTTGETCQEGVCSGGTQKSCPASDQCHLPGTCDPQTGLCSNPAAPDDTPCDDNDKCTTGDVCKSGVCTGTAVTCSASDQCHDAGTCDPQTGQCTNPAKADDTPCDDNDKCTTGDVCTAGVCGGTAVTCSAIDQCHDIGVCDKATGQCTNPAKPDLSPCGDNNACTQTDVCMSGFCRGTDPIECPPPDQCHEAGICNTVTGKCEYLPKADFTPCDDHDACTIDDVCMSGFCTPGTPKSCPASDQCHIEGVCNPADGSCSDPVAPDNTPCDDGSKCTTGDVCTAGVCGGTPVTCTPSDQCHVAGVCEESTGKCTDPAALDNTPCDDGLKCTINDVCTAGVCSGTPVTCHALDQCHIVGECQESTGECSNPDAPDNTLCDDSDACTKTDTCQKGLCTGGDSVICPAPGPCQDDGACNTSTGECIYPNKPSGTPCDDDNLCNGRETCDGNGSCVAGTPVTCAPAGTCKQDGVCDPTSGNCTYANKTDGTPCGDGAFCNGEETCQGGTCTPGTSPCNAANCETCDEATDSCVGCPAGTQCSGGTCVCVPNPNPCGGAVCGQVTNSCGNVVTCGSCPNNATCTGGVCVPNNQGCTSNKDCPGPGKCCCWNSKSKHGTCSDITGCGNGKNLACLPA